MDLENGIHEEISKMIDAAGEEFPCRSCPSKDECRSFKWFAKWFGEKSQNDTVQ